MSKRLIVWGLVWAAGTGLAFLVLDPIVATFLAIMGLVLWVVVAMAGDWDRHPSFEQRELSRARRRAEKRERTKEARAKDRARWEAHQARKARRG